MSIILRTRANSSIDYFVLANERRLPIYTNYTAESPKDKDTGRGTPAAGYNFKSKNETD
jgi:hypothetical protein